MLHRPLRVLVCGLSLAATALNAQDFDFDWDAPPGWTNTFSNTYVDVDQSGIDVVVTVSDPDDRTNPASPDPQSGNGQRPALFTVSGQSELRIFPDFIDTTVDPDQAVTVTFEFFDTGTNQTSPALVSIEDLVFRDIDSTDFSDGVILEGLTINGYDLPPNNVQLGSANIDQVNLKTVQPNSVYTTDYDDPEGWVSAEFSRQIQVTSFTVTHYPAIIDPGVPTPPNNPSAQAITISDFTFFKEPPLTISKTVTSPVPAIPGDNITYLVEITNNRPTTQTRIDTLDRYLPAVSYVSGTTEATGLVASIAASDDFQTGTFPATGSGWAGDWTVTEGSPSVTAGVLELDLPGYFFGFEFGSNTDIERVTSLSPPGVGEVVSLSFELSELTALQAGDTLTVYARDGAAPWTSVATYTPPLPSGTQTIDITAFAGAATGIRFATTNTPATFLDARAIGLDNIDIKVASGAPVSKDDGGGPNPLVGVTQPPVPVPGDQFVIPQDETLTISYAMQLAATEPLPLAAVNAIRVLTAEYPTPLFSAAQVPINLECPGLDGSSTIPVVNPGDDGWWDGDSGRARFGDKDAWLGINRGGDSWTGFRFQGITIPNGAVITEAHLSYEADNSDAGGNPAAVIYAVDSADAPQFGTSPPVNLTDATVDYQAADFGDWTKGTRYQSPDISGIIQELVDDNGGLDFAAIAIVLEDTGDRERRAVTREGLSGNDPITRAPTLTISYGCPSFDRGDAPSGYGDPRHDVPASPDVFLGTVGDEPDAEGTTQFSIDADGDNLNGSDDENGVSFRSPANNNQSIIADVVVTNTSGGTVNVCGWLDRPDDSPGSFSAADGFCQSTAASGTLNFTWANLPTDQSYSTYARFRISSAALTTSDWSTAVSDGEVEDYRIDFDFQPTLVSIGRVDIAALSVSGFLGQLGVPAMDATALWRLNASWQPPVAAGLQGAARATQLAALENYLDPDGDGMVAVLSWETLEERGTVGFFVERRSEGDEWQRINSQLLPGLITAPMGGEYSLADPGALPGNPYEYRLIELEARGTTRVYGPFALEIAP